MTARIPAAERSSSHWQNAFLIMLPRIRDAVQVAFRYLPGDDRDEAVQEAVANACVRFARLAERGCVDRAFPTVLARFAVAQVRDGRRVGTRRHSRDICAVPFRRRKPDSCEPSDRPERREGGWEDAIREDGRTAVPDQAGFRIDFPAWLSRLSRRDRQVAQALALGHSTGEVADRFAVSSARVAQLRRELRDSWRRFHGELDSSGDHGPSPKAGRVRHRAST
jgi:hypothetical protein